MKTVQQTKLFIAPAQSVFDTIDDLAVSGMHMTSSSMPMMGGKMNLTFLTEHKRGMHSRYRWTGNVLWMKLDFTVEVSKWIPGVYKSWETVGPSELIIYSWFRMELNVVPTSSNSSKAILSIDYKKPNGLLNSLIYYLSGNWYARWCIKNMLNDTERALNRLKLSDSIEDQFTGED